jgi:membrane-associated phospholipid phosphatase
VVAPISDIRGSGSAPALLPGRARGIAVVLICCSAALVTAGALLGAGRSQPNALSRPVDSWIQAHIGAHRVALEIISNLGVLGSELVALLLVLAALAARRRNVAALTVISVPLAWVLTEFVLKPLVHERIDNYLTYPSGHTQAVICVATVLAIALLNPTRARPPGWLRVLVVASAVAVAVAVAISMIGLDYHYFTDTLAGAAAGAGVALCTALCLDTPRARHALRAPRRCGSGAAHHGQPDQQDRDRRQEPVQRDHGDDALPAPRSGRGTGST